MRRPKLSLGSGSSGLNIADRNLMVSGTATGVLGNISQYLPNATWSKVSGPAGLSIAANGDASISSAIGIGQSISGIISGSIGNRRVDFGITLTGAGTAVPTLYLPAITTPGLPAQPTRFTA